MVVDAVYGNPSLRIPDFGEKSSEFDGWSVGKPTIPEFTSPEAGIRGGTELILTGYPEQGTLEVFTLGSLQRESAL